MAENPNLPGGALPPKPAEASKVQPKKETVRINLPPKPTSAPTIKLPTLAPGGPPPATTTASAAPVAAAPVAATKVPTPPPAGAAPAARVAAPAAPATAARAAAPVGPAPRTVAPMVVGISKTDSILAAVAAVAGLAAVGMAVWIAFFIYQPVG